MNYARMKTSLASIVFAISLLGLSFESSVGQEVVGGKLDRKWRAKLYDKNSDYVEVKIDASSLDGPVYDVSLDVMFFKGKQAIGQQRFQFTDDKLHSLMKVEAPYVRYFHHDFGTAKFAKGDIIRYRRGYYGERVQGPGPPSTVIISVLTGGAEYPPIFKLLQRFFGLFRISKKPKPVIIGVVPERKTAQR